MKEVGKVLNLFISKQKCDEILLDESGVVGDKFYAKEINRSVLLISYESYDLAKRVGITPDEGSLGENILLSFNPYKLPLGTEIKIADVVLEISQNCTLCNSLSKVDAKLPKLLKNDRGIFAKVVKGGVIKVNDKIFLKGEN